jgi:hypothetical protein
MTYFISHSSACRAYAKCYGWQETLANFFVKTRRPSLAQLSPMTPPSSDILSKYQSLVTNGESVNNTNINGGYLQVPTTPVFEISSSTDDALEQKLDLSTLTNDFDLTQTYASSQQSPLLSSSLAPTTLLINRRDSSSDSHGHSSDTIMTPPQSISASREDLLSLLKTENSNDDLSTMVRNESDPSSSLQRRATSTSMPQLSNYEENIRDHKLLGSLLRQFLGWPIALLYKTRVFVFLRD